MSQTFEEVNKVITSIGDENLRKVLQSALESYYPGDYITAELKEKFGDRNFKVSMRDQFQPTIKNKSGGISKYYIDHISWDGDPNPNPHQVFFFLKETFTSYLKSLEFDRRLFTRRLSTNISRKYISWYLPLQINNIEFNAFELMIIQVVNKVNDKVVDIDFMVEAKDRKLGIKEIKGKTIEEALLSLQDKLEDIYYSPKYNPERQHLIAKYERSKIEEIQKKKVEEKEETDPKSISEYMEQEAK